MNKIIVFIILLSLTSCINTKYVHVYENVVYERLKTIPLYNNEIEDMDLKLVENGLTFYFKKEDVKRAFYIVLDTLSAMKMRDEATTVSLEYEVKYTEAIDFLNTEEYTEIINVHNVDSLKNMNYFELSDLRETNIRYGFRDLFTDALCMLLDEGKLMIIQNGITITEIYKNKYYYSRSIEGEVTSDGYSSIRYTTESTEKICDCPPIISFS